MEQEPNEMQKRTFVQRKRKGTQTQINGIECKQNGNLSTNSTVFNKGLIFKRVVVYIARDNHSLQLSTPAGLL